MTSYRENGLSSSNRKVIYRMQGYLGPYTPRRSKMSVTPCDYIYPLEVKIQRVVSQEHQELIINLCYTCNNNNYHF